MTFAVLDGLDWRALVAAMAIGLLIAALLGPLRGRPLAHKTLVSVCLAAGWLIVVWVAHGDVVLSVPEKSFSKAILVFLACNAVLQLIDLAVWDILLGRGTVRGRRVSRLIMHVVGGLALLGAGMLALYNQFPDQARGILVTSTVVTAVLGLALQDMLGNVIGGLALEFESPFHLGDWVRISGYEGEVIGLNWRTTAIRTRENHVVYLTNSSVSKTEVVNYYRPDRAEASDLFVGVAYDHAPGEVKDVLLSAVRATPGVLADPAARVFVHEYGDFAILYRIRFWYDDQWALPRIRDAALTHIWYHLRRHAMGIPFPIRDVRLTTVPEDGPEVRAQAERRGIGETLAPLSLLETLAAEQIAQLAEASRRVTFTRGEPLVHQGEPGEALYVIERGRVRVDVAAEGEAPVTVAHRGPGEYFGEMSVLTGEPRSATIAAEAETTVVEVDRAAFAGLLRTDPLVAEQLARTVALRAEETSQLLSTTRPAAEAARARTIETLVERIKHIFGLT